MLNLDQIKEDACRRLAIIELIDKAVTRKRTLVGSTYYRVFGTDAQRQRDLAHIDKVINRLRGYLQTIINRR